MDGRRVIKWDPISNPSTPNLGDNFLGEYPWNSSDHLLGIIKRDTDLRATAHAADPKRVWNRARQGHIEVVRSLTEAGSDKDKSSNTGSTPLYIAAQNGHIEIVCFWTEAGSDNLGQGKVFCRRRQVRRDAPSSLGKWWYRWDGALAMWNFLWKSETLGFMFKVLFFQKDEMQFLFQSTWAG